VNFVNLLADERKTFTQLRVALHEIFIKFTYRVSKLSYCITKKVELKENVILCLAYSLKLDFDDRGQFDEIM